MRRGTAASAARGTRAWAVSLAGAAVLACVAGGCTQAPRQLETSALGTRQGAAEAAETFWRDAAPPVRPGTRVAVVEFAVEIVTEKDESAFNRQLAVLPPIPIGIGVNALGPGRKRFDFGDDFPQELAGALYEAFAELAAREGLTLIPPAEVQAAGAFERIPAAPDAELSINRTLNLVAIDAGRIKKAVVVPVAGTRLVQDQPGIAEPQRDLLGQLGAGAALRVHFRIGTFKDRVAVMQGSAVHVTTARGDGRLVSRRSLVSAPIEGDIAASGAAMFGTREVDQAAFASGLEAVFPPYATMLLEAMVERRREGR